MAAVYDRVTIKREAKLAMRGSRPHFMLVALVYCLLTTGLGWVVQFLTLGTGGWLGMFLVILVALFSMVMYLGFCRFALSLVRGEPAGTGHLFSGFAMAGRAMGVQVLVAIFVFLWSLLLSVPFIILIGVTAVATVHNPWLGITVILLLYLALVVGVVIISLRYAMAEYALLDRPEDGILAAIRRSKGMMSGWKGKLFILDLSFLGWDILVGVLALAGFSICLAVVGTDWIWDLQRLMESLNSYNYYNSGMWLWEFYSLADSAFGNLLLCTLVGDLVSLPLLLWVMVYQGCARARFYNYVGGYDYEQYMRAQSTFVPPQQPRQDPWERPADPPPHQGGPAQSAGRYYVPPTVAPPPEQPPQQTAGTGYYTIVPPVTESAPEPAPEDPPAPQDGGEQPGEKEP